MPASTLAQPDALAVDNVNEVAPTPFLTFTGINKAVPYIYYADETDVVLRKFVADGLELDAQLDPKEVAALEFAHAETLVRYWASKDYDWDVFSQIGADEFWPCKVGADAGQAQGQGSFRT